MKTEYTVEIWNHIKNDEFCLIATLKNKQTFFIGMKLFMSSNIKCVAILKEKCLKAC